MLIGNPFCAEFSPTGQDLFVPCHTDDAHSVRYLRENLAFTPSMSFVETRLDEKLYMPWEALFRLIPGWIAEECARLNELYGEE